MEICSKLYNAFLELEKHLPIGVYKYVSMRVAKTVIVNMSCSMPCKSDILATGKDACINLMEERLKAIGMVGTSLELGSPNHGVTFELRFIRATGQSLVIVCGLQQYPNCCGSLIISPLVVVGESPNDNSAAKIIHCFMECVFAISKINRYSHASYILSEEENGVFIKHMSMFVDKLSDNHIQFVNTKTNNSCYLFSKIL